MDVMAEAARWQHGLETIPGVSMADGIGCESGDPLDVAIAAVNFRIARLIEALYVSALCHHATSFAAGRPHPHGVFDECADSMCVQARAALDFA